MNFDDIEDNVKRSALESLVFQRDAIDKQIENLPMNSENRKKVYGLTNQRNKIVNTINSLLFGNQDKRYADEEFGYEVFKYIATTPQMDKGKRQCIEDAMEAAKTACKKSQEWVDEVRGNHYLFTSNNLKELASNGDLKLLIKFSTLNQANIKKKSTLNSAAGEFSMQKIHAEIHEDAERRIKSLEKISRKLEKRSEAQEANLRIINRILGDNKPHWKESAIELKKQGFTQEAIASALDLNIRTIKRVWKEI